MPWTTLRRLALEAGLQPPVDEPLSAGEVRELALRIAAVQAQAAAPMPADEAERAAVASLAALPLPGRRVTARAVVGFTDRGQAWPGEGGLAWGAGWNTTVELGAQVARSRWWAAMAVRATTTSGWGGHATAPDDPLSWRGWDLVTRPGQSRPALLLPAGVRGDVVRAVVGARLGHWALSAGWEPRRNGPGLGGALLLDRGGRPFPALTARRTAPFNWRGVLRPLGPDQLLLRTGLLSHRQVTDGQGTGGLRDDQPWFFQWLVRWRVTDWFRFGCSQTAMAVPREGTLWPDLFQINFPAVGTTWREQESGPETDRLFAAQMEFRWRDAPWPWLPAAAGRAWWEYAGTDFLPSGPGGVIPQISVPASVAGCELVSPRWDLAFEYAETLHPLVLWYSNGGFPDGYTQSGWLLGHPLGGAGERLAALVRWRSPSVTAGWYAEIELARATWGDEGHTPAPAGERTAQLTVGDLRGGLPGPWRLIAAWHRTALREPGEARRLEWGSAALEYRF